MNPRPRISFGLPVRNAAPSIRKVLGSILGQDRPDLEVVVCDNASNDATPRIVQESCSADPRVRFVRHERDVGQIENFNACFRHSRGEFFRWIGSDDWLEPTYASRCVAALDADPDAIAASTDFAFHDDRGNDVICAWRGERFESDAPDVRFARMLWFYHADDSYCDPLYGLFRRRALERTPLFRMMTNADWVLAAELGLIGRFVHVPELLAHRGRPYALMQDREAILRRYHPTRWRELPASAWTLYRRLLRAAADTPLTVRQRLRCHAACLRFLALETRRRARRGLGSFRRERLRLNRTSLRSLAGRGPHAREARPSEKPNR